MYRLLGLFGLVIVCSSAMAEKRVFDVPKLDNIAIDGKADDWGEKGFVADALAPLGGKLEASGYRSQLRLAWDQGGLLVLVSVKDDIAAEAEFIGDLWKMDCVEFFVADSVGSKNMYQVLVASGADKAHGGKSRVLILDHRHVKAQPKELMAETAASSDGPNYVVEIRLPWKNLGAEAAEGDQFAFQLLATDNDGKGGVTRYVFFPSAVDTQRDTGKMQAIRLASAPSPTVKLAAMGKFDRFSRCQVDVVGARALAQQFVEIRDGEKLLAREKLAGKTKGLDWATARLVFPLPKAGDSYGPLNVRVSGQAEAITVVLPDEDSVRKKAFKAAELDYTPLFVSPTLGRIDFKLPGWVDQLVGGYTIETKYYNAEYNEVAEAAKPGRYGAVVKITPKIGAPRIEYLTLYRQPKRLLGGRWEEDFFRGRRLPPELGITAGVVEKQSAAISDYFRWRMLTRTSENDYVAILLAGLSEMKPDAPRAVMRNDVFARNSRWWYGLKKTLGLLEPLKHLVDLPANYEKDKSRNWPVILFLHGATPRGDDLNKVRTTVGLPTLISKTRDLPFIIVAPLCPANTWWNQQVQRLDGLLSQIEATYRVDSSRVYVTGFSMGGSGSWAMACEYPHRFAAAAPAAGRADPRDVQRIMDVPIWAFHGAKDATIPLKHSTEMVDALEKIGGKAAVTIFPEHGHDISRLTYSDPRLYQWLLSNQLGKPAVMPPSTQPAVPK